MIGLAGLVFAIYTHMQSVKERKPLFMVDPVRTTILSQERAADAPILVFNRDGTPIESDLIALRFFLWNDGKEVIDSSHVLEPVHVRIADTSCRILEARVLSSTRENVTHSAIHRDPADPEHALFVDFRLLEYQDGIAVQVIYEGKRDARVEADGWMLGHTQVENIDTPQQMSPEELRSVLLTAMLICSVAFVGLVVASVAGLIRSRRPVRERWFNFWRRLATSTVVMLLITVATYQAVNWFLGTPTLDLIVPIALLGPYPG